MKELNGKLEERLAKSRRISASQQQTTERLLKKTAERLKEDRKC